MTDIQNVFKAELQQAFSAFAKVAASHGGGANGQMGVVAASPASKDRILDLQAKVTQLLSNGAINEAFQVHK